MSGHIVVSLADFGRYGMSPYPSIADAPMDTSCRSMPGAASVTRASTRRSSSARGPADSNHASIASGNENSSAEHQRDHRRRRGQDHPEHDDHGHHAPAPIRP